MADIGLDVVRRPRPPGGRRRRRRPGCPPTAVDTHKWKSAVWVVGGTPGLDGAARAHLAGRHARRRRLRALEQPGRGADPVRSPPRWWAPPSRRRRGPTTCSATSTGSARSSSAPGSASTRAIGEPLLRRGRRSTDPRGGRRRRPHRSSAGCGVGGAAGRPTVLTPHDGEYAAPRRPSARRRPARRGPRAGRRAPARSCCSRGRPPSSPIPTAGCWPCRSGDARLATLGSGDVLSGMIARPVRPGRAAVRGGGGRRPPPRTGRPPRLAPRRGGRRPGRSAAPRLRVRADPLDGPRP